MRAQDDTDRGAPEGAPRETDQLVADGAEGSVAELVHEVRALRREVSRLQALVDGTPARLDRSAGRDTFAGRAADSGDGDHWGERPTDRRTLLRRAGVAAAGAVAGGAALALQQSTPAAAADGDALTLGAIRVSSSETELRYGGADLVGDHILLVQDSPNSAASSFGAAVAGMSINGHMLNGVLGHTQNAGAGVVGSASGPESIAGQFITGTGSKANLRIGTTGPTPHTRNANGSYQAGDVVGDGNNDLWLCVASGTTGASAGWRKIGGPDTAGQLHVLPATKRCYDSRPGFLPAGGAKTPLGPNVDRLIDVKANGTGVFPDASAVLVNVTVVGTSASGWLALFKGDITFPGNSTVSWDHAGTIAANSAVVALGTGGGIKARVGGLFTDFVIDVIGYYR
jgi:hypothetical protein